MCERVCVPTISADVFVYVCVGCFCCLFGGVLWGAGADVGAWGEDHLHALYPKGQKNIPSTTPEKKRLKDN